MDKLLFIGGILFLAVIVSQFDPARLQPNPVSGEASRPIFADHAADADANPRAGNGIAAFSVDRAPDGHFYADVSINGSTTLMLVDTGATTVLLSRADAQRAGIQAGPGDFNVIGQTASGDIALKEVTVDRIAVGPVTSTNVPAVVAEADIPISLLGQSFLRRVGRVEIDGDHMTLR